MRLDVSLFFAYLTKTASMTLTVRRVLTLNLMQLCQRSETINPLLLHETGLFSLLP